MHQTLSRELQKRFIERAHRVFTTLKSELETHFKMLLKVSYLRPLIQQEVDGVLRPYLKRAEAIGVGRLVNIARQRTERRQRIENVKRFKQEIELIKQQVS